MKSHAVGKWIRISSEDVSEMGMTRWLLDPVDGYSGQTERMWVMPFSAVGESLTFRAAKRLKEKYRKNVRSTEV